MLQRGLADLISRILFTLFFLFSAPFAEAYVRARTSEGNFLFRTDNQNIVCLMNNQTAAGMSNANGEVLITPDSDPFTALQGALNSWSAVSSADLNFAPLATTALVNDANDGNHVFAFLDNDEIREVFVGGALAVTRIRFSTSGQNAGELIDTDIIFNPNNRDPLSGDFVPYSTTLEPGTYDIQSIATHETGHLLGSDHTVVSGASMFPTIRIGENFASFISADDASFLTSVYPSIGSANEFGAISGTVRVGEEPATGVFVTAIDWTAGVTIGVLTDLNDGTYRISLPSGTYVVTVEALDGPVTPSNLSFSGAFTQSVHTDFFGGGQDPVHFLVATGSENIVDITMRAGESPLDIDVIGFGFPEGDSISLGQGPILLTPGEATDLVMAGPGIDGNLTDVNIQVLVPGVTIRPGSLRVGPFITSSDMPIVHVTVDVTNPGLRAIGTFAITTNATAVYTGALVVAGTQPSPVAPVIGAVVNGASFGLPGVGSPGEILSIFGSNFGSNSNSFLFPRTEFDDVRVSLGGMSVPLFAVHSGQINFLAPSYLPSTGMVEVRVASSGGVSDPYMLAMQPANPGMFNIPVEPTDFSSPRIAIATFTTDGTGTKWLVTTSLVAAAYGIPTDCAATGINPQSLCGEPAAAGDILTLWVTGLGLATVTGTPDTEMLPTQELAPSTPLYFTTMIPEITIGGVPTKVLFSGLAPGTSGLYQINIVVPEDVPVGDSINLVLSMPNDLSHQLPIAIRP